MGRVFILAIILDAVYQMKVHSAVYAGELLITAFLLAIVPYLAVRGPTNRLVRMVSARNHADVVIGKTTDVGRRQI